MLTVRISISSDSILDTLSTANEFAATCEGLGLEVVSMSNEIKSSGERPYCFDLYVWDDEVIELDEETQHLKNLRRVKELAQNAAAQAAATAAIDEIPF